MVQASNSVSAKDCILSIAAQTGKDYSAVISSLEENEIETLDDLLNLDAGDFKDLGFSMALRNRVKALRGQDLKKSLTR